MNTLSEDKRSTIHRLCRQQSLLFKKAAEDLSVDDVLFVQAFMSSSNLRKIDDNPEMTSGSTNWDKIYFEAVSKSKRVNAKKEIGYEAMGWMGYVYRYWSLTRHLPSKAILKYSSPLRMASCYVPYHTQDVEKSVQLLSSSFKEENEETLRKIYNL